MTLAHVVGWSVSVQSGACITRRPSASRARVRVRGSSSYFLLKPWMDADSPARTSGQAGARCARRTALCTARGRPPAGAERPRARRRAGARAGHRRPRYARPLSLVYLSSLRPPLCDSCILTATFQPSSIERRNDRIHALPCYKVLTAPCYNLWPTNAYTPAFPLTLSQRIRPSEHNFTRA